MKTTKPLIIGVLIYLVGFGILSAIPITHASAVTTRAVDKDVNVTQLVSPTSIPDNGETIGIIVGTIEWNDAIYGATLRALVGQYKLQLEQTGYQVLLQTAALSDPTVETLRAFLQGWYTTYGISGVVLRRNVHMRLIFNRYGWNVDRYRT